MTNELYEPLIELTDEMCNQSVAICATVCLLLQYGDLLSEEKRERIINRLSKELVKLRNLAGEAKCRLPING